MTYATPEVKDLYHLLENEFLPLDLASKVQPLLTKISKLGGKISSASSVPDVQLSQYIPALEKVATLRVLQQVSNVYQTVKVETLTKMVPFFGFSDVERILVDAVKHNFIALKVDHMKGAVIFGDLGFESDHLHGHLSDFAVNLSKSRSMINASAKKVSKLSDTLPSLDEIVEKEHKRLLARKSIIEKRKEEQERHLVEMEREKETKRIKKKKAEEAEKKRLATEFQEMKNKRICEEIEKREQEEAEALLKDMQGKIGKKPLTERKNMTKQQLMDLALQEQVKGKQEMEKKLQKLIKTMDHLERAKREEAAPLVEAAFHKRLAEEKLLHERQQEAKYERMRAEREERLSQVLQARRDEREIKRKMLYYLRTEEERLNKLREEEKAHKREGITAPLAAPASAASGGKYVPRHLRRELSAQAPPPPAESDRWGTRKKDDRAAPPSDKWRPRHSR
nr:eukaryotic translation initiation factor 3 subunit A-like [Tanacetum cinerariifolium]